MAVAHANRLLFWQENLDADEYPPKWMHPFDDKLEQHFERVAQDREARHGGGTTSNEDEEVAGMTMVSNEYSANG